MSKFYTFRQNNSGGRFIVDIASGISEYVIIEAKDADDANRRAENIGLYFNGCDDDRDCPCCGDRWYPTYEDEGENEPLIYGEPIKEYNPFWDSHVSVHYLDKPFEVIERKRKK